MTEVERTADGHHVVIDGRRWRATDPSIPPAFTKELQSALMTARRAVGTALRTGSDAHTARAAVHDAKVALGERGQPWWEPASAEFVRTRIAATIRTLLDARAPHTACPSDIARIVGGQSWRAQMEVVRDVAEQLAADGTLVVTQGGKPVRAPWRGPVRLRRADTPLESQGCRW